MTIEEKAIAYDRALKYARIYYTNGNENMKMMMKTCFPVLVEESEDERIRKKLISLVKNWDKGGIVSKYTSDANEIKLILAWLEKQGEQKHFDYENANIQQKDFAPQKDIPRYNIGDVLCDKSCTTLNKESQSNFEITDIRNGLYICDKCSFPISQQDEYELVAKRIEQKSADKIEPKFKVGDWIISTLSGIKYPHLITDIQDGYYIFGEDDDHAHIASNDNILKLWTIQDAKDGDILFYSDSVSNRIFIFKELLKYEFCEEVRCYCDYDSEDHFYLGEHHTCCWADAKILHPATKKQRDTLFAKMKEVGYEWDAEKKKLKKIVVPKFNIHDCVIKKYNSNINDFGHFTITDITGGKYWYNDRIICDISEQDEWELYEPIRQKNHTWSEEDNKWIESLIQTFEDGYLEGFNQLKSYGAISWLKSLKQRIGR